MKKLQYYHASTIHAQQIQMQYNKQLCGMIQSKEGDSVLLRIVNLKMRGVPNKSKGYFVAPCRVVRCIGRQPYELDFPYDWRVHNVFYVLLRKLWKDISYLHVSHNENNELDLEDSSDERHYTFYKIICWTNSGCETRQ